MKTNLPDDYKVFQIDNVVVQPRQYQVARLVGESLTNEAIADELGITKKTVQNHLSKIYEQLRDHGHVLLDDERVGIREYLVSLMARTIYTGRSRFRMLDNKETRTFQYNGDALIVSEFTIRIDKPLDGIRSQWRKGYRTRTPFTEEIEFKVHSVRGTSKDNVYIESEPISAEMARWIIRFKDPVKPTIDNQELSIKYSYTIPNSTFTSQKAVSKYWSEHPGTGTTRHSYGFANAWRNFSSLDYSELNLCFPDFKIINPKLRVLTYSGSRNIDYENHLKENNCVDIKENKLSVSCLNPPIMKIGFVWLPEQL